MVAVQKKKIKSYFDKNIPQRAAVLQRSDAVGYDYRRKRMWFVEHLRHIKGSVLDIGCNVGNFAAMLRDSKVTVDQLNYTGVDITEQAIAFARQRKIPGSQFFYSDAVKLDFEDESFEAVTMVEVIEHFSEWEKPFKEACRVLKKKGVLLLSTPNAECKPWIFDERLRFCACKILGRAWTEKDNPLKLDDLDNLVLNNYLTPFEGPKYYNYRPYHIFKGNLWWPPYLVTQGLLKARKRYYEIEDRGKLIFDQKRNYCQSLLLAARKE